MERRVANRDIAGIGLFSAIVVILQYLGSFIRLGPFAVSLVLIPIAVGGALYGINAGGFLGAVFGFTVLISGDAAAFLAINPAGTVVTVMLKGILCGTATSAVYKGMKKFGSMKALMVSSVVCPFVNTGVFLLCCSVFFLDTMAQWAKAAGFGDKVALYMILGLVGGNFIFEVIVNMVLCPAVLKIMKVIGKGKY